MSSPLQPPAPRDELRALRVYRPAGKRADLNLKLDANEGAPLTHEAVRAALAGVTPEDLRRYPGAARLESILAARFEVPPERVLVSAGGDDALGRICQAFLGPGRTALLTTPTFEMIERYVHICGARACATPWLSGPFPTATLLEKLTPEVGAIFVVSPNNPTGACAAAEDLHTLAEGAAAAGSRALIVADLAYEEFADSGLTAAALQHPNVAAVRTFSKAWGLAGLRVGYVLAAPEVIDWLRIAGHPYAVSGPSLAIVEAWLQTEAQRLTARIARVRSERSALRALLSRAGAAPLPSQANFILARFADAAGTADALAARGIAVRRFHAPDELTDMLRITLPGDAAAFERLTSALEELLTRPDGRSTTAPVEDAVLAKGSSAP